MHGPYSQHHILPTLRNPYFAVRENVILSSRVTHSCSPGQHVHVLGRAKSYPPYPCLCVSWHLVFPARLSFVHKNSFRFPFPVSFVPLRQGDEERSDGGGMLVFRFPFSVFRSPPYILYNKVSPPSPVRLLSILHSFFSIFLKNLLQSFASLRKSLTFALAKREHLLRVIMEDVFLR